MTPPNDNHLPIYNGLASDCKSFVSIVGGGHCYFANTNFNCDFGESTSSGGITITRADQQTKTYSILDPWFDYILKGNSVSYSTYLSALTALPTEVISQTTCQALELNELDVEFEFYPNPVNEELIIMNPSGEELHVEIFNLLGERIFVDDVSKELDLTALKSGYYRIQINHQNYSLVKE